MKSQVKVSQSSVIAIVLAIFLGGIAVSVIFFKAEHVRTSRFPGIEQGLLYYFSTLPQVLATSFGLLLVFVAVRLPKIIAYLQRPDEEWDKHLLAATSVEQALKAWGSIGKKDGAARISESFVRRFQYALLGTFLLIVISCLLLPFAVWISLYIWLWVSLVVGASIGFGWLLRQYHLLIHDSLADVFELINSAKISQGESTTPSETS